MDKQKKHISLEDIKKENPFRAPEHYFDTLSSRIADHVKEKTSPEAVIAPSFKLRPVLLYATGFACLGLLLFFGISHFNTNKTADIANATSLSKSQEFYEYDIASSMDEATLIEKLSSKQEASKDSVSSNGQTEPIIDYLIDQNVDIKTITDAL